MEKCSNAPFTFLTNSFIIGFLLFLNSIPSFGQTTNTAGTFRFETPTENVLFLRNDVIESLYPEIEARRAFMKDVIWEYNADLHIVIFSKRKIESEYFTPLTSPYEYVKQL